MDNGSAQQPINPMQEICTECANGKLDPLTEEGLRRQLSVEGRKRIDAFVFELFFKLRLTKICADTPGLIPSFGWHIGYNRFGDPTYWFRLLDAPDAWNACDNEIAARLRNLQVGPKQRRVTVVGVIREHGKYKLQGAKRAVAGWETWQPLELLIAGLDGKGSPRGPRPMSAVSPEEVGPALSRLLSTKALRDELPALSAQRVLMNCVLGPLLGRDGTDLDAMILTPDGELRYLEFKRKFPAAGGRCFGIDIWPHHKTILTMAELKVSCLHIILVNPVWEKGKSPIAWLDDRRLDPHWTWVVANLNGDAFMTTQLHTSGTDSGHRSAERTQKSIRWERTRLLQNELRLDGPARCRLSEFLISEEITGALPASFEALKAKRAVRQQTDD